MSGRLNVPGRVSVILATYNGEKYIEQCIESILNQTYGDIELVVVDDGSSDSTIDMIRDINLSYMAEWCIHGEDYDPAGSPIHLYRTNGPNHFTPMGGLWPYIVGAGNSTGEFLSFHGQDDWSEPRRITELVAAIEDKSLAYSQVRHVDPSGREIKVSGIDVNDQWREILENDSDFVPHLIFSSTLFRKDLFWKRQCYLIGQYNYERLIGMRMFDQGGFAYVEEPLYNYREHPAQASRLGPKWPQIVSSTGYDPNDIWYGRYNYGDIGNQALREETLRRINNE